MFTLFSNHRINPFFEWKTIHLTTSRMVPNAGSLLLTGKLIVLRVHQLLELLASAHNKCFDVRGLNADPVTAQSVVVKREPSPDSIEVQIKQEGQEDEEKYVYFTKSEDGKLDIWDLSGFDLGPETPVDEQRRNVGFTRKNISDVSSRSTSITAHSTDYSHRLLVEIGKLVPIIGTVMPNSQQMRGSTIGLKKSSSKCL